MFYLRCPRDELGPALPLRTLVPLGERGLVGRPAALLVVEPHGAQTHALLQVVHPISSYVNEASQSTWQEEEVKRRRNQEEKRRRRRQGGKEKEQLACRLCHQFL